MFLFLKQNDRANKFYQEHQENLSKCMCCDTNRITLPTEERRIHRLYSRKKQ